MKIVGLDEFEKSFKEFEKNGWAIHYDCHFKDGNRIDDLNLQLRAQVLAEDIGFAAMIFKDYYLMSIDEIVKTNPLQSPTIPMSQHKTANSLKHIFFLIRAYQDALYRVFLRQFGQQAGRWVSIKNVFDGVTFKPGNPVSEVLKKSLPDYAKWFFELRDWRNNIKNGQAVSFQTSQHFVKNEVQMQVVMVNRLNDNRIEIDLETIAFALNMSACLTRLVIATGIEKGLFSIPKTA